jgi:hypothetical protein
LDFVHILEFLKPQPFGSLFFYVIRGVRACVRACVRVPTPLDPLEPRLNHWIPKEVLIREYILLRPNSVAEDTVRKIASRNLNITRRERK